MFNVFEGRKVYLFCSPKPFVAKKKERKHKKRKKKRNTHTPPIPHTPTYKKYMQIKMNNLQHFCVFFTIKHFFFSFTEN